MWCWHTFLRLCYVQRVALVVEAIPETGFLLHSHFHNSHTGLQIIDHVIVHCEWPLNLHQCTEFRVVIAQVELAIRVKLYHSVHSTYTNVLNFEL